MTRLAALAAGVFAIVLPGCVVLESTYEAEVAGRKTARAELEVQRHRVRALTREVQELSERGERSALEGRSLGKERAELLNELEDLRVRLARTDAELAGERALRREREVAIEEIKGSYASLVEQLEGEVAKGQIEIYELQGRLQIRALEQILFPSGSAEMKPEGRALVARIAAQLRGKTGYRVQVEGHTDSVPISTSTFPSNWELSSARSVRVARLLVDHGLEPERVSAAAYGPHRPIASNDTPEGRARNRRIEIVLVPDHEG